MLPNVQELIQVWINIWNQVWKSDDMRKETFPLTRWINIIWLFFPHVSFINKNRKWVDKSKITEFEFESSKPVLFTASMETMMNAASSLKRNDYLYFLMTTSLHNSINVQTSLIFDYLWRYGCIFFQTNFVVDVWIWYSNKTLGAGLWRTGVEASLCGRMCVCSHAVLPRLLSTT